VLSHGPQLQKWCFDKLLLLPSQGLPVNDTKYGIRLPGELTPNWFSMVSARSVAAQALSIFGDHSDVMSVRQTGFGLMASSSIQEIMDLALITHAASLKSRVPFVHFFDGFRSSHEINKIEELSDDDIRVMIDYNDVIEHRKRAMTPD